MHTHIYIYNAYVCICACVLFSQYKKQENEKRSFRPNTTRRTAPTAKGIAFVLNLPCKVTSGPNATPSPPPIPPLPKTINLPECSWPDILLVPLIDGRPGGSIRKWFRPTNNFFSYVEEHRGTHSQHQHLHTHSQRHQDTKNFISPLTPHPESICFQLAFGCPSCAILNCLLSSRIKNVRILPNLQKCAEKILTDKQTLSIRNKLGE